MKNIDQFLNAQITDNQIEGLFLSTIISNGLDLGFTARHLINKLFPLCEDKEIHKMWSDWTHITDREEIRLRLQALLTFDSIDESLIPFLIFYFRSSDSLLYQTSAQIIGKHLPHHPKLKAFLGEYLYRRKVDPSVPLVLNGLRGHRRILITLTTFYIYHGTNACYSDSETGDDQPICFPVDYNRIINNPPLNHLDLSATMLALSIILRKGASGKANEAAGLLLDLPGKQDVTIWDRNTIRNWGTLLRVSNHSIKEKNGFSQQFLETGLTHFFTNETFNYQLHALFELDEVIKALVFIPQSKNCVDQIKESDHQKSGIKLFCKLRFNHWVLRETEQKPPFELEKTDEYPTLDTLINSALRSNGEYRLETIAKLLQTLTSKNEWRLQSVSERSARAFFLLDFASNTSSQYRQEELLQMISTIQSTDLFQDSNFLSDPSISVLDIIIQCLLSLEQTAKGNIPDGRLIQKIDDENLLIQLLPTATDSEILPTLADAFEHRIRLLLIVDKTFNVEHYLYKVLVREPHPNFYRIMREITLDRQYGKSGEPNIDLSSRFDYFFKLETRNNSNESKQSTFSIPFWNYVTGLQERIRSYKESEDLFDLLDKFSRELEGTGIESLGQTATLHDLINITQQGSAYWFRSGFPAVWKFHSLEMNKRLTELQYQIRSDSKKLKPDTIQNVAEVGEAYQRIKHAIQEAENLLCPSLGGMESDTLKEFINHLSTLMDSWMSLFASASRTWRPLQRENNISTIPPSWDEVFQVICKEKNTFVKTDMLTIMLSSCFRNAGGSVQKSWFNQYQVLTWAAKEKTDGFLNDLELIRWRSLLVEYWKEMILSAKEQNQEARVVQLVKDKDLEWLRQDKSIHPILHRVKIWCFERYDFSHAYVCNRELNPEKDTIQNRVKTFREYFNHFSYVWIAIIVGVIMMFDFGDPWTELAEIGDIFGVFFTFILGVGGTYLYVFADLRKKINQVKGEPFIWTSQLGRVAMFLGLTLLFTVVMILIFYYMFSNTDQVVAGPNAILHIMSWTGFALFVGVFFGLIGKS